MGVPVEGESIFIVCTWSHISLSTLVRPWGKGHPSVNVLDWKAWTTHGHGTIMHRVVDNQIMRHVRATKGYYAALALSQIIVQTRSQKITIYIYTYEAFQWVTATGFRKATPCTLAWNPTLCSAEGGCSELSLHTDIDTLRSMELSTEP